MAEREPKFQVGQVVRVVDPDAFIAEFGRKVANRDAVVKENLLDWTANTRRGFAGRVMVEFQKRAGHGKVFTEILNERDLIAWETTHGE